MRTGSLRLFRVAGIDVYLHVSWLLIFVLLSWSLADGYYPALLPDLTVPQAWVLGAVSAILLFGAVLVHELAHSLVARRRGMAVESITLFLFGGVSTLRDDAPRASTEFLVAIVGPLASFVLAGLCLLLGMLVGDARVAAVLDYLGLVNALLGGFNLIPGFPLDGGRVLRALVWQLSGDRRRGLVVAVGVGQLVGYGLMALGVVEVVGGDPFDGIWLAVIGWFLQSSGAAELRQVRSAQHLGGLTVGAVMRPDTTVVDPNSSVELLIDEVLLPGNRRAVPVALDGRLVGIVALSDIGRVPVPDRARTRVADVMGARQGVVTTTPEAALSEALGAMAAGDYEQLPVLRDGQLVGMLTRADVVRQIQLREALHVDEGSGQS